MESKKLRKLSTTKFSTASTGCNSGTEGSGDRQSEEQKRDFTSIMYERWHRANADIPSVDKWDIMNECPVFNNGKKVSPDHQHHPEFTQTSYLRLRS